jgi:hypothetical protein
VVGAGEKDEGGRDGPAEDHGFLHDRLYHRRHECQAAMPDQPGRRRYNVLCVLKSRKPATIGAAGW